MGARRIFAKHIINEQVTTNNEQLWIICSANLYFKIGLKIVRWIVSPAEYSYFYRLDKARNDVK